MTAPGRRAILGVGLAAAAAGIAVAWWRNRAAGPPAGAAIDLDSAAVADDVWSLRLARPEGGEFMMASLRGRPALLNFWATWCPPCVREMPEIDRFAKRFGPNGWQVVGIAVDQAQPVRDYLARNPVVYPIALAGFDGVALSRRLGNEAGGLPFTVAIDARGKVARRHIGETHFEALAAWANEMADR